MEKMIAVLEKKRILLERRHEIVNQLGTNPREVFAIALRKEYATVNAKIIQLDEAFFVFYSSFKSSKKLLKNGDIDTTLLSDYEKECLREIQTLIRKISLT